MRYFAIIAALLLLPVGLQAKSYSSGSHSYSSGHSSYSSSSHSSSSFGGSSHSSSSFGGSSGHSYSSGSSHSSSSGSLFGSSKSTFSSPSKTYSSGTKTATSHPDSGYSSGTKTYSSHSDSTTLFTHPKQASTFDSAAAHARQADTSTATYNSWKNANKTTIPSTDDTYTRSSYGQGSSSGYTTPRKSYTSSGNTYNTYTYIPPVNIFSTRQARIHRTYLSYYSRPQTYYRDPYSNFFWWWLLDQSLQDQAYWTYHHRYSMDPSRYQLLMQNQQLAQQVQMLENQQVVRDPSFTPSTLDRDLMYSDQYVQTAAHSPIAGVSTSGKILSRIFAIALFGVLSISVIWLIFFKRWGGNQT